ncbi:MAG: secondary thiamine-phosphate synthase enzyme [bacterium]|jgi:secondary thiamine-phosphate synthase enzyme
MAFQKELVIRTKTRSSTEITYDIEKMVSESKVQTGLCSLFLQHTSASLILCENADPDVHVDLESFMSRLVQDGDPHFIHTAEGPDDMAGHIRSVITKNDITIPIQKGRLALGTWQGIYLWEHRTSPHRRKVIVTILG